MKPERIFQHIKTRWNLVMFSTNIAYFIVTVFFASTIFTSFVTGL